MASFARYLGWRPYNTDPSQSDSTLEEAAGSYSVGDLRRMLQLKEENNQGGTVNINLRNFFWEIVIFGIIVYVSYQIYSSGYLYASITFLFAASYLLFLFSFNNMELKEHEMPWSDCPDYFIRQPDGDGYKCVNTVPESIQVSDITGLSDDMTKKERCEVASQYDGLSWEWCDDPRNM
jgi:hypothetical protein